jgi:hypothetical protein
MATERLVYVDVDVVGGAGDGSSLANAYSSLSVAEAAEQGDISVGTGSDEYVILECHNTGGSADTTKLTINGWTTAAANYILIRANSSYRHAGIWDDAKYRYEQTNVTYALEIVEDYVRFEGVQFGLDVNDDATNMRGIAWYSISASNDLRFSNLLINFTDTSTTWSHAMQCIDADSDVTMENVIIWGGCTWGIYVTGSSAEIVNCTVNGCFNAIYENGTGTYDVYNCLVFENSDDFVGSFNTIDYCASDDGDGTNAVDISGQTADDYAALVVDADGGNFKPTDASSALVDAGDDDPTGSGYGSPDAAGNVRSSWDVGALEYVSAGGGNAPTGHIQGPLAGPLGGPI